MEKIILKNWENGEKFTDFFDPLNKFDISNNIAYLYGDSFVSSTTAHRIGFDIDPSFKLPGTVHNRVEVGDYVESTLGISRQKNPKLFFQTWQKLGEGLPKGSVVIGVNRNNNDK